MAEPSIFQPQARDAAQQIHMDVGHRLSQLANTPDLDADIAIKIFNATKDVAAAVAEKRIDPLANLPIINITFVNGRMSARIESFEAPPEPLLTMDMMEAADLGFELGAASKLMLAHADINLAAIAGLEDE